MGSSNRDYMRDETGSNGPSWAHDVPTTKWLIIISVGVFFLQTILTHDIEIPEQGNPRFASVTKNHDTTSEIIVRKASFPGNQPQVSYVEDWFPLEANDVYRGQIWRLVTFVFCHHRFNPIGLVFNMLALWYLGSCLERMYGSREFLFYYLSAGLVCGLIFIAFGWKLNLPDPLMGASPCIMAILTLYATHFPRQEFLFCWVIPIQVRYLVMIYAGLDIYWIMQAYSGHAPWQFVAYTAELWDIGFALLYRRMNWRISSFTDNLDLRQVNRSLRRASRARKLKVFQPEPISNLDEQVDAILAKIHEHGSESLTERERSILQRASDQAKNRI